MFNILFDPHKFIYFIGYKSISKKLSIEPPLIKIKTHGTEDVGIVKKILEP